MIGLLAGNDPGHSGRENLFVRAVPDAGECFWISVVDSGVGFFESDFGEEGSPFLVIIVEPGFAASGGTNG